MFKKIIAGVALGAALVMGGQVADISQAEAADVWVYSNSSSGNSVYVDDNAYRHGKHGIVSFAWAKWVSSDGSLLYQERWEFSVDEGYVWAYNGKTSFAISRGPRVAGEEEVKNRPDLVALYNWISAH